MRLGVLCEEKKMRMSHKGPERRVKIQLRTMRGGTYIRNRRSITFSVYGTDIKTIYTLIIKAIKGGKK